jgi:alcohol dehydrogenase
MGAVLAGAGQIVAIDTVPEKLALARELGATITVNPMDAGAVDEVLDLTHGGVDYSFEMAGVKAAAANAYAVVKRGGALVVSSLPSPTTTLDIPLAALVSEEKRVLGSYMGSSVATRDIPRYVELYKQGRLPVDRLRSRTLNLAEINTGFDRLADGHAVREVVSFPSTNKAAAAS